MNKKVKVQYASDLHIEFINNKKYLIDNPIKPIGEVLILAGDIGKLDNHFFANNDDIISYFSNNWKLVLIIPGNHEYYHIFDYELINQPSLEIKIKDNVWVVNNKTINYKDIYFICTTLWSHIPVQHGIYVSNRVSDFMAIKDGENTSLTFDKFNKLYYQSVDFLKEELEKYKNEKIVVATHHGPTNKINHNDFKNSRINCAFISELGNLITNSNIKYWIYGHTHRNIDTKIENTKIVSNQLGYVDANEHKDFKFNKYFLI